MRKIPEISFKLSDNKESAELVNFIDNSVATGDTNSIENDDEDLDIVEE